MPTPVTSFSYHCNGPMIPQMNIGGSSGLVPLGVCQDGADIAFRIYSHDIKHDGAGGPDGGPAETIFLNADVTVRFSLVPYGGVWTNRMRQFAQATGVEGVMSMPGTLYGLNNFLPSLYLPTIFDPDGGWLFTNGRIVRLGDQRSNDKESIPSFEYQAFNYLNPAIAATILNRILYARF